MPTWLRTSVRIEDRSAGGRRGTFRPKIAIKDYFSDAADKEVGESDVVEVARRCALMYPLLAAGCAVTSTKRPATTLR